MAPLLKILLASEHTLERRGIKAALAAVPGMQIVKEVEDRDQLLPEALTIQPDVIITSFARFPFAVDDSKGTNNAISIVVFSMQYDPHFITSMKKAGAKGFLLAKAAEEELIEAIYAVTAGEEYYCSATLHKMEKERKKTCSRSAQTIAFTKTELKILELISREYTDKEIAAQLRVSRRTIETHKSNMRVKTKTHNNVGFMNFVRTQGIIFVQLLYFYVSDFAGVILDAGSGIG